MVKAKSLAISAIVVMVATFLGRIFGFIREMTIAYKFGASASTDAFLVAFTVPNILYSLVVMGALGASFIPIFTGLLANDEEKSAWRLASAIFNILAIAFGIIILALIFLAPQVISLIAPGFKGESQLALSASLLRIMTPALIFMGISGLMAGVLNSYNHFAAPSFVALAQNILLVACVLLLAETYGIYAAAIGLLVGSIGQVVIQLPVFFKRRFSLKPRAIFSHESLSAVGKLFLPVLIALAAGQANVIIDKWFASQLSEGSISYLNYAFKVGSLPSGTLIAAVAIVLFPTMSEHASRGDLESMRSAVATGIRIIALIALPAAVGLFVLSVPITRLLFQQGAFTSEATFATAPALAAYAFGIIGMGLNLLLARAFYSLKDGITPMVASIVFVILLCVLDYILVRPFAHVGLAAGYAVATTVMVSILLWRLQVSLNGIEGRKIFASFIKMSIAALLMGIITWATQNYLLGSVSVEPKLSQLISVASSIAAGIAMYIFALWVLRVDDLIVVLQLVRKRFSRAKPQ